MREGKVALQESHIIFICTWLRLRLDGRRGLGQRCRWFTGPCHVVVEMRSVLFQRYKAAFENTMPMSRLVRVHGSCSREDCSKQTIRRRAAANETTAHNGGLCRFSARQGLLGASSTGPWPRKRFWLPQVICCCERAGYLCASEVVVEGWKLIWGWLLRKGIWASTKYLGRKADTQEIK